MNTSIQTRIAETLTEYLNILRENTINNSIDILWYRGQSDSTWDLAPGAFRSIPYDRQTEISRYTRFMTAAPARRRSCPKAKNYTSWLLLMQHYGLKTRLLDWTASPLVALYFALNAEKISAISAVWVLAPTKLNASCRTGHEVTRSFSALNQAHEIRSAFDWSVDNVTDEKGYFAVLPDEIDPRVQLQLGRFTLHGCVTPLNKIAVAPSVLFRIDIPARCNQILKSELRLLGMHRSSLFPDLDNLSKELNAAFQ